MKFGKIAEGFELFPSIGVSWYTYNYKNHYYITFKWLFWYFTTFRKFKWE